MRIARRIGIAVVVLVALALTGLFWIQKTTRASLPTLEGELELPGLAEPVVVERDAQGVPTVRGSTRLDVARATGFLHGQERFFQMDLMRRSAAGELAALVGAAALEADRATRIHRFRDLALRNLASATPENRGLLEAYAAGVNHGVETLAERPVEYLVLRAEPQPWRPEDTTLVVLAMYLDLQDETGQRDTTLGLMHDLLPAELFDFLVGWGDEWDAPLTGDALATPPVPPAQVYDLRERRREVARRSPRVRHGAWETQAVGSNSWVVAGSRTADGVALLANDMHLGLSLPNIWYRASLAWQQPDGTEIQVTGVTLPGAPTMTAGSNGHIAWGYTNSYGDWSDAILLDLEPDGRSYRTPEGPREFEIFDEVVEVRGGEPETVEARWTRWGPVIDQDHLGRTRALRWVAHDVEAVNLGLLGMERAKNVDEALDAAALTAIPVQNCVIAGSDGRIGWTLMGPLPRRRGFTGRWPVSWASADVGWDGYRASGDRPKIVDPPSGLIWTANNRVLELERQRDLGDGGYAGGARARQIRDALLTLDDATVADMLSIQLDDRALFLERWRELLLTTLSPGAIVDDPRRAELRRMVEQSWTGRAEIASVGYRMVRGFRSFLAEQVFRAVTAPCLEADEEFDFRRVGRFEGPLWQLVTQKPPHLLDPRLTTWDEQMLAAVDATLDYYLREDGSSLEDQTWGQLNTVRVEHPMARFVPRVLRWVVGWQEIAPQALPGDSSMPRVQSSSFGASQRTVVAPGREDSGLFHMPGGQSGHPVSPHYLAGHEAWAAGEARPFLPGAPVRRLVLSPS